MVGQEGRQAINKVILGKNSGLRGAVFGVFAVILAAVTVACAGTGSKKTACDSKTLRECTDLCNEGNGEACFVTGFRYHKYPEIRDDRKSIAAFTRGCELGHMESCGNLGLMNEKGWGKEKDPGRAIELYEQACRAGVPVHCRNVGRLSEGDSGFPVDPERAERAYQRALELALEQCEEGVAESCAVAGHMYKDGKGTGENMERARMLLRKSCKMGYSWACKSL